MRPKKRYAFTGDFPNQSKKIWNWGVKRKRKKLDFFDPWGVFYRVSVERGQFQGPLKIEIFTPSIGSGKADLVQFEGRLKPGPFLLMKMVVLQEFSPLRQRTFISLKKGKFVFQKSLFKIPFKPDWVSFGTPNSNIWSFALLRSLAILSDALAALGPCPFFKHHWMGRYVSGCLRKVPARPRGTAKTLEIRAP